MDADRSVRATEAGTRRAWAEVDLAAFDAREPFRLECRLQRHDAGLDDLRLHAALDAHAVALPAGNLQIGAQILDGDDVPGLGERLQFVGVGLDMDLDGVGGDMADLHAIGEGNIVPIVFHLLLL